MGAMIIKGDRYDYSPSDGWVYRYRLSIRIGHVHVLPGYNANHTRVEDFATAAEREAVGLIAKKEQDRVRALPLRVPFSHPLPRDVSFKCPACEAPVMVQVTQAEVILILAPCGHWLDVSFCFDG